MQAILSSGASVELRNQAVDRTSPALPAQNDETQLCATVPEIQGTTRDVATHKVKEAAKVIGGPCITEVIPLENASALADVRSVVVTGYCIML